MRPDRHKETLKGWRKGGEKKRREEENTETKLQDAIWSRTEKRCEAGTEKHKSLYSTILGKV